MTRSLIFGLGLCLAAMQARADGYVMGAGRWTCERVVQVAESGTPIEKGQVFGWILGYWSFASTARETGFVDTVERVGAEGIANATVEICRSQPQTPLFRVSDIIIRTTN